MAQEPLDTALATALADPQQATDLLLYRLAKLHASAARLVTRLCERHYGITRREWGMVMWLAQMPGLQPSAMADKLELDRARASRAIASLQAKGLLRKQPHPTHRGQAALHLTEAGEQLHAALWPQIRAINQKLLAPLGRKDLHTLDHWLRQLQDQAAALDTALQDTPAPPAYPPRRKGSRDTPRA
jgi:DNA-binding MarR family transcriptional regulator